MNSEHNLTLDTADAAARQAAQLAQFVRGILVRHGRLGGEFGFWLDDIEAPPPSARSEAAAPIMLRLHPIALDLATLLRLRDIRKSAILAPIRLDRDLGGTTPLAVLTDLQTALRTAPA